MSWSDVTPTELALLQALWSQGPSPIRALAEALYPGGGPSHYATVQKLLERLEAKGLVERDRQERAHRFRARLTRAEYLGSRLRDLADRLSGGALAPLVTELVRSTSWTEDELAELRGLLDDGPREDA